MKKIIYSIICLNLKINMNQKCKICNKNIVKSGNKTCSRYCCNILKKQENWELRNCHVCNTQFSVRKKVSKKICSDNCRKIWALIPENKKLRLEKAEKSCVEKFGTKSSLSLKYVKDKIKQKKLEKYGNENYNNIQQAKQTKLEKFGDEKYNNYNKNKQTKLERYGDKNFNNREKAKTTMNKNFGVSHAMKLEKFQKKQQESMFENYQVKHPLQSEKIKQKTKETNKIRYGVDFISQNEQIKQKIKDKHFDNFINNRMMILLNGNQISMVDKYNGQKKDDDKNKYKVYKFSCNICNSPFQGTFSNLTVPVCKKCNPNNSSNKYHKEISEFITSLNVSFSENNRYIIKPLELDFFIPDYNIAIEFNGNYWHSERNGNKNKNYHINKTILCEKHNIRLIHIFEDEWILKKDIIKSMIKNVLQKTVVRIFARKCQITQIFEEQKQFFLKNNNIYGDCKSDFVYALEYNHQIVAAITFNKIKNNNLELMRFCSILNSSVIGGFSKLLKHAIKNLNPNEIIAFADFRYTHVNNIMYQNNCFKKDGIVPPTYFYFKKNNFLIRYDKIVFDKKALLSLAPNVPEFFSEWEIAQYLGMDRIWDCGKIRFKWKKA